MEDLWKLREMGYQVKDVAERVEYDRLVKSFHEDEERVNLRNLLYGEVPLERKEAGKKPAGDKK